MPSSVDPCLGSEPSAYHPRRSRPRATAWTTATMLAVMAGLQGCASPRVQGGQDPTATLAQVMPPATAPGGRSDPPPIWQRDAGRAVQARVESARLLAQPVSSDAAVRLALIHSPALQALLNDAVAASAQTAQGARLPNPVLSLSKLVRQGPDGRELSLDRMLSLSLLDLLTWPRRHALANQRQQQIELQLAHDVLAAAAQARRDWVLAVAAQQSLVYARQVYEAAKAAAELARRMQAAGNFSALQAAREQAFQAEAQVGLTRAAHEQVATREALVRTLGLQSDEAQALALPDRLPDPLPELPQEPAPGRSEDVIRQAAIEQGLDVRLARADLQRVAAEQGVTRIDSLMHTLDLSWASNSETGKPTQQGWGLDLSLPLFDLGDLQRDAAQAAVRAAAQRAQQVELNARSQLREAWADYQGKLRLARHWRDEVVPLRERIAQDLLRQYNGMLVSVFDLLTDARERVNAVNQALDAQRDFWLADAALQAALLGAPSTSRTSP